MWILVISVSIGAVVLVATCAVALAWHRGFGPWVIRYSLEISKRKRASRGEPIHLLLAIADHFEPCHGGVSQEVSDARVRQWVREYPRLFGGFADSDGRPPQHTFFYPIEQYQYAHVDELSRLCAAGFGEVEVHLHHDRDDCENLRQVLTRAKRTLAEDHGLLGRHRVTGEPWYGFVHGNWALDNARPDGRWCGVNNELDVLRETGCYADFTLPSFPSPTQTRQVNSIYYAVDDPLRPKSHDRGVAVGTSPRPERSMLLVQGPLILNWRERKWKLLPRVENGCIQGNQPPTEARLDLWLSARVQIPSRPDWFFVKLHTHGAPEANQRVLLGPAMAAFHASLARRAKRDAKFRFHYVTAREMYNLAQAAEAGWSGSVFEALDFELGKPPIGSPSAVVSRSIAMATP